MNENPSTAPQTASTVSSDNGRRDLLLARPDNEHLRHLAVVGNTYTILVMGDDTAGRYALIDMYVPPGGGPSAPPRLRGDVPRARGRGRGHVPGCPLGGTSWRDG